MARALEQNPKTLPPKALRQWEHVYESAQARGLSKQGAAAQAWCAVKRKYKKSGSRWVLRKKPIPPSKQPPGCVKARRSNPPKVNYAIIADERPVGWWSRPVRIVTRDEAIDCQRGIQGRCIALVGAKDRVSAESMLADLERAKIEVTTPKGQVVYSGSLLDFDSEAIRPYLNFVDAGRILQLALGQSSEVKLASGKLRARLVAANNPAKKKRPTFAAARQAIFAELGAQGWTLKPSLKTPQAQKDIDGRLVILHFKPEAVWMEIKNETTSRSTHSDIREFEPRAWVATIPRWMAIDLKLQRDLDRGYDENPAEFMAGDWVVVAVNEFEDYSGVVLDDGGADPEGNVWHKVDLNFVGEPHFYRTGQMRLATTEERAEALREWYGPLPRTPIILQRGAPNQRQLVATGRRMKNTDCGCDHGRAKRMMNPRNY